MFRNRCLTLFDIHYLIYLMHSGNHNFCIINAYFGNIFMHYHKTQSIIKLNEKINGNDIWILIIPFKIIILKLKPLNCMYILLLFSVTIKVTPVYCNILLVSYSLLGRILTFFFPYLKQKRDLLCLSYMSVQRELPLIPPQ